MKVAVISIDSDIGQALVDKHTSLGDDVVFTTTRDKSKVSKQCGYLELTDRTTWQPMPKVDRVYFLIGMSDNGARTDAGKSEVLMTNAMLPVDYLGSQVKNMSPDTQVVVFTSQYGSIGKAVNARAYVYRISKAALNMGVRCLALAHTKIKWCVYHPGIVKTKMIGSAWTTFNFEVLEVDEAADKCIQALRSWDGEFRFLEYSGGQLPW